MVMTLMSNPKGSVGTVVVAADGSGDTTDIQTGINLLPATGGCVYIKEGTYYITEAITIATDNVSIIGCGRSTLIQSNAPGAAGITIIYAANVRGITISKVYLYGSLVQILSQGIEFDTVTDSTISDCWIENCNIYGIEFSGTCVSNTIYSNFINNNDPTTSTAINLSANSDLNVISSNQCSSQYSGIATATGASRNIIVGNQCNSNSLGGIELGGDNNVITGNYTEGNNTDENALGGGITIDGDNNIATNNRCVDNYVQEILIRNGVSNNNLVQSNQVIGTNRDVAIRDLGANTLIFNNIEN